MNKIEEMIKELCPKGVEKVKLGEVGSFYNGVTGKSKEDFVNGNAKFISYMNIFTNPKLKLDVEDRVRIGDGEKQNVIQYGDVLFTTSSETPEECGMSSVLTKKTNETLYLNSFCFGFRFSDLSIVLPSFCAYLFRSESLRQKIAKTANGVTRFNISKKLFEKLEIPLPPLSVQQEIVRVLDSFSSLQSKLEEELEARQKQMEYYREKLLTFEKGIPLLSMNEICVLKAGKAISAEELVDIPNEVNIYPCYGGNGIRGYIGKKSHSGNYAIIGRQGALCGCVNWVEGDFYATEHAVVANPKNSMYSKFLYYLFLNADLNQYKSQGAQPGLSVARLNELKFRVPPLSRQQEIVSTLDTMSSLIDNLKAEIELRKSQYEYYREKLLTFE